VTAPFPAVALAAVAGISVVGTVYLWVAMGYDSDVLIGLVGELGTIAAYALGEHTEDQNND